LRWPRPEGNDHDEYADEERPKTQQTKARKGDRFDIGGAEQNEPDTKRNQRNPQSSLAPAR
jgi:hypothetical protein